MDRLIASLARTPRQRTTLYGEVEPEQIITASFGAARLLPTVGRSTAN